MQERIYNAVRLLQSCKDIIINVTPDEAVEIYELEGIIVPEADWAV